MERVQRHLRQWTHNRGFLQAINKQHHDWIITVAFYTALHAIDCLLAFDGVTGIEGHPARNRTLFHTNRYKQVSRHYMPLYNLARTARYLADPMQWVPYDRIEPEIIKKGLYPIEKSVVKLVGLDIDLPSIKLAG